MNQPKTLALVPAKKRGNRWKHGMTGCPEYVVWSKLKARCYNPHEINFERYGARGITVCPEWRNSFMRFFNDMGPKPSESHSIERKDNSLGYCKENCRWASIEEQGQNKRNNRNVSFSGDTKPLSFWCRALNLNYNITRQRIVREHWTAERAFTTPTNKPCKN